MVNFCSTSRYQGRGYYVSLLAEARGQRPLPDVKTVEDLKSEARIEALAMQLDRWCATRCVMTRVTASSSTSISERTLRSATKRLRRSCSLTCARLLRALFGRVEGRWRLEAVDVVGVPDIPAQHRAFLLEAAWAFAADTQISETRRADTGRRRLAILRDPNEPHKPSNDEALERLVRIAPQVGLEAELISPDALERLPEFDALFNRASPDVNSVIYEFVRRAESLGMPVVDDTESILKCLNKVYMHELMSRHQIAQPRTLTVQRDNVNQVAPTLGLPCVLKLPGQRIWPRRDEDRIGGRLAARGGALLQDLGAVVAQEWLPTGFDWRVGVYDRRPLYVAKYFMAPGHWKIIEVDEAKRTIEGKTMAMSIGEAPEQVIDMAVRAANLIGRGLYGVDLKQVEDRCYLIEVNCNPNLDAGNEDQVLGDALYREILGVFARRIAERKGGAAPLRAPLTPCALRPSGHSWNFA